MRKFYSPKFVLKIPETKRPPSKSTDEKRKFSVKKNDPRLQCACRDEANGPSCIKLSISFKRISIVCWPTGLQRQKSVKATVCQGEVFVTFFSSSEERGPPEYVKAMNLSTKECKIIR